MHGKRYLSAAKAADAAAEAQAAAAEVEAEAEEVAAAAEADSRGGGGGSGSGGGKRRQRLGGGCPAHVVVGLILGAWAEGDGGRTHREGTHLKPLVRHGEVHHLGRPRVAAPVTAFAPCGAWPGAKAGRGRRRRCEGIHSTLRKDLSSFPFERRVSSVLAMRAGKCAVQGAGKRGAVQRAGRAQWRRRSSMTAAMRRVRRNAGAACRRSRAGVGLLHGELLGGGCGGVGGAVGVGAVRSHSHEGDGGKGDGPIDPIRHSCASGSIAPLAEMVGAASRVLPTGARRENIRDTG
ncbi:hypothetical protein DFH07DRAFT_785200 [Mycena maculata]|uniref:Uncharacterized protein n=1 Tax=Mycena maculata TaxID=230809 RepID=A0AAD7MI97_9AGAR|nr:hypothetical protein DFH07DRAFT_785200 [Mycena maculata]